MNDQIDGADKALQSAVRGKVQTSAQAAPEVAQKEPALGGSYIRNPDTGDLAKQSPADKKTDQE